MASQDTGLEALCTILPSETLLATELCALPHSLDDELGYRIVHTFTNLNGTARATWTDVKQLPFVYPYEDASYRFTDVARRFFVSRLKGRNGCFF